MSLLPVATQLRKANRDYDSFQNQIRAAEKKAEILAKVAGELSRGKNLQAVLRSVAQKYGEECAAEIEKLIKRSRTWPRRLEDDPKTLFL